MVAHDDDQGVLSVARRLQLDPGAVRGSATGIGVLDPVGDGLAGGEHDLIGVAPLDARVEQPATHRDARAACSRGAGGYREPQRRRGPGDAQGQKGAVVGRLGADGARDPGEHLARVVRPARLGPVVRAVAQDSRSQTRNRELALERLRSRLQSALSVPQPRRATQPTAASRRRRMQAKRRRGELKRARRRPADDE